MDPPADSSKSAPAPASTQKTGAAPAAGQDQQDQKADSLAAPTNPPAAPKTTPKNAGNSSFQSGIPEDSAPEIKIGVNEVNLIFTVTDKHGKFIKNLTKSDIHVLDVSDLTVVDEGLAISLMRDRIVIPYGVEPDLCPVLAWQDWEAAAGLTAGPAFRSVDRDGRLGLTRLGEKAITRMVQRAAERAGLDESRYSALSLRLGMLASARPG